MIHAEHDRSTSLADALVVLDSYNTPHMLVARGMRGHGVLMPAASSCILRAAGSYLLTGAMPKQKLSDCDAEPTRKRRSLDGPLGDTNQRLRRLFERS